MSIVEKIERYKIYRAALEIITHEEAYDKRRSILSGEDLFKLCHERYLLLQQILEPLKEKLGKEVTVTDIMVTEGVQNDACLIVEYLNNDKKNFVTISHLEFDDFETIFDTSKGNIKKFLTENKETILHIFDQVYQHSFDHELHILSTTRQFICSDDSENFAINDSLQSGALNLCQNHLYYEKMKSLYIPKDNISHHKNIANLLMSDCNMMNVFSNVKIYEEELPKVLVKK